MFPRTCSALLLSMLFANPVGAQTTSTALPTSVDILIFPSTGDPATMTPLATRTTVIGTVNATTGIVTPNSQCGRTPSAASTSLLMNPTQAEFDDPFTSGKKCVALLPTGLPDGTGYRGVAQFTAPSCQPTPGGALISPCSSKRSQVGVPPFSVASPKTAPADPTSLVLRP